MNLYLDDDLDANELIGRLQHEGHEVISPRAVSMSGAADEAHLTYAAAQHLPVLTANTRSLPYTRHGWRMAENMLAFYYYTERIILSAI